MLVQVDAQPAGEKIEKKRESLEVNEIKRIQPFQVSDGQKSLQAATGVSLFPTLTPFFPHPVLPQPPAPTTPLSFLSPANPTPSALS